MRRKANLLEGDREGNRARLRAAVFEPVASPPAVLDQDRAAEAAEWLPALGEDATHAEVVVTLTQTVGFLDGVVKAITSTSTLRSIAGGMPMGAMGNPLAAS